jgi:general secretion pathway protein M
MNTATRPLAKHLAPAGDALGQWWRSLGTRERRALQLVLVVLAMALLWWVALAPAARVLRSAPAERELLDAQLQQMQALAAEARRLRGVAPISPDQAGAALKAAAARLGSRGQLTVQGGRATLSVKGLTGAELSAFLAEARTGARARVVQATLAQASPGLFDGNLVLGLGEGAP